MTDLTNLDLYHLQKAGLSQSEIGRKAGISRHCANGRALRHVQQCEADERDLKVCADIDAGLPTEEIARRYDVSRQHVARLRKELEALDE